MCSRLGSSTSGKDKDSILSKYYGNENRKLFNFEIALPSQPCIGTSFMFVDVDKDLNLSQRRQYYSLLLLVHVFTCRHGQPHKPHHATVIQHSVEFEVYFFQIS